MRCSSLVLLLIIASGCGSATTVPDQRVASGVTAPGTVRAAPGASTPPGTTAAPSVARPRAAPEPDRARYAFVPSGADVRGLEPSAPPPPGFERVPLAVGSFGSYLRGLPLRPAGSPVRAYDGRVIHRGDARIFAVAELDVSPVDLQQCADSVIRLHGEWQWSRGRAVDVGYHFVSGDLARFARYAAGERPELDHKRVRWITSARARADHQAFRDYLDMVFTYASTVSLAREATPVDRAAVAPGDFFVLPGGPGHAVLVLDLAVDHQGHRIALLGQGYMPAQDFQVLASQEVAISPWFSLDGEHLTIAFWPAPFPWSSLHRFSAG